MRYGHESREHGPLRMKTPADLGKDCPSKPRIATHLPTPHSPKLGCCTRPLPASSPHLSWRRRRGKFKASNAKWRRNEGSQKAAMPWRRCSCNPHLKPALEEAIAQFPLKILGFHSDNGSEFINHVVARLLNKLRIQQTKSRSRQCNDNALVEGKNGTIVQKHMGHMHIPQCHDARINDFYRHYWNVYLNFHRPSGLAEIKSDAKGKL